MKNTKYEPYSYTGPDQADTLNRKAPLYIEMKNRREMLHASGFLCVPFPGRRDPVGNR